ncbi:RNA methyltransferase [Draconibacterium sp. IB214405]|uniref:RNA methyltransferase n=1 Tax=Draconibacterium sp. IB214405 TaxID=3097352 RepID=UPI002A12638F|nr:RNA methyltransferase [Draconibacterium sp. IB214405]MDX8338707.1 RNA methyltransferase [Draconibacterium sp. IB214405]
MIGKSTIKLINSLALKKYRSKEKLFLIEGDKMVKEALDSDLNIEHLIVTSQFLARYDIEQTNAVRHTEVDERELKKMSLLQHPQNSLAICELPEKPEFPATLPDGLSVYLDGIQDPGNMGTIVRICDWYGIKHIFCSPDSVDLYNPKVIQASMGSFNRVTLFECEFPELFALAQKSNTPCFGAFMNGENIYQQQLPQQAVLVMGNEGNGIRESVEKLITNKLSIPNFSENNVKAESLNVSVATAIICSEFKRSYSK